MIAPCKECTERILGCHCTCERYICYAAICEEHRKKRQAAFAGDAAVFLTGNATKTKQKNHNRRRK